MESVFNLDDAGGSAFTSGHSVAPLAADEEKRLAPQKFAIHTPVAPRAARSGVPVESNSIEGKPLHDISPAGVPEVARFPPANPELQFDSSVRKNAYKSAIYYSECYIKGVKPTDADNAAKDVKETYNKWWVDSNFHQAPLCSGCDENIEEPVINRATVPRHMDEKLSRGDLKRARDKNGNGQKYFDRSRKVRRGRGGLRDVIDAVTIDAHHDSETQSHCGVVTLSGSEQTSEDITSCDEDFIPNKRVRLDRTAILDSSAEGSRFKLCKSPSSTMLVQHQMKLVRSRLIEELKITGGDTEGSSFLDKLEILSSFYRSSRCDARRQSAPFELDGNWFTLSKPTYFDCKGRNNKGNYLYSLGRMAFDMFRPTNMLCSIQGIFNTVHGVSDSSYASISVPRTLRKNVRANTSLNGMVGLRTYNIVVAFTTESNSLESSESSPEPSRPIRGIMTNYGYFLPNPDVPNRLSVWFTGGSLEVNEEQHDMDEWKRLFHHDHVPKRDMQEYARVLAAKILLGAHIPETMDEDGTMHYSLKRPIGGHGRAFCDVIYLDETLRIMRGHQGSIFVFSRVPS